MKHVFLLTPASVLLMTTTIAQERITNTACIIEGFSSPENVCVAGNKLYVASINDKGNHGFVSEVDLKTKKVITLNLLPDTLLKRKVPAGLAVVKNILYVCNHNRVFGIDRKSGKLLLQVIVPGAERLNDLVFYHGKLLVSETTHGVIYEINVATKAVQPFITDTADIPLLSGVNGLALDMQNAMLYVSANKNNASPNSIIAIDMKTKQLTILYQQQKKGAFFDGITISDKQLLITDWAHKIYAMPLSAKPVDSLFALPIKTLNNNLDAWDGPPDVEVSAKGCYIFPLFRSGKVVMTAKGGDL